MNAPDRRAASALPTVRSRYSFNYGDKLAYLNELTGASPMASITAFLEMVFGGFCGEPYRFTDGTCAAKGRGEASIDGQTSAFEPHDVFVVRSWSTMRLQSEHDAALFSYSDRPMQQAAGILREAFLH